jgi:3-deoxy-manno-octulosonate cytidylyltransferase (CMP-KDO synthetase)
MSLLEKPSIIKVTVDKDRKALYFSRGVIPYLRNLDTTHTSPNISGVSGYRPTVAPGLVRLPESSLERAESLEQLRWLENGYSIHTRSHSAREHIR